MNNPNKTRFDKSILITGGAGFIGSHLVDLMVTKYPNYRIFTLDALTYAGSLKNLKEAQLAENFQFVHGDIADAGMVNRLFETHQFDGVIHLAAESHVDRSISDPIQFVRTNVVGTANLLEAARSNWNGQASNRFYHVSTDEVFGSLGETGLFTEASPYDPRSPYSASKAGADHLVRAFFHTYQLPILISNCSNNYGPRQFPEKLLPVLIKNIRANTRLPIYGDGKYTRDWLWVFDHVRAIDLIYHQGHVGETYNIGGDEEWRNIDLVQVVCDIMDELLGRTIGESRKLIQHVKDRAGHDRRYAIDSSKLKGELGWQPTMNIHEGLRKTAEWYASDQSRP